MRLPGLQPYKQLACVHTVCPTALERVTDGSGLCAQRCIPASWVVLSGAPLLRVSACMSAQSCVHLQAGMSEALSPVCLPTAAWPDRSPLPRLLPLPAASRTGMRAGACRWAWPSCLPPSSPWAASSCPTHPTPWWNAASRRLAAGCWSASAAPLTSTRVGARLRLGSARCLGDGAADEEAIP